MDGNGNVQYVGSLLDLLNPYALLAGATTLALFLTHGAVFVALKTEGTVRERGNRLAGQIGLAAAALAVGFLLWTQLAHSDKGWTWVALALAVLAWVGALAANRAGREGWAFLGSAVAIALAVVLLFGAMYPEVMPSSLDPAASLTIANASSTAYTLKVMSVVALVFTPLVLLYQGYTYWVFRRRLSPAQIADPHGGSLDLPHEVGTHAG